MLFNDFLSKRTRIKKSSVLIVTKETVIIYTTSYPKIYLFGKLVNVAEKFCMLPPETGTLKFSLSLSLAKAVITIETNTQSQ